MKVSLVIAGLTHNPLIIVLFQGVPRHAKDNN